MVLSGLDLNRCIEGGYGLQLTTRLQAIQLYPYHSGLKVHTLLNGFAVHPFSDMLLSRSGFPPPVSQMTSQVFSSTCDVFHAILHVALRRNDEVPELALLAPATAPAFERLTVRVGIAANPMPRRVRRAALRFLDENA